MATPNTQLKQIAEELRANFDNSQYIDVIPFDDDPPEKYEIHYHLQGLIQDENGKVVQSREHSIFINIPFGYPHFPPSCTPKTPTFHPDFDQAAICIGEYWNKDRTLSDLIIYIGRMITGEIYSTENAFNESALAWYTKIAGQLPFEKVDLNVSEPQQEAINFLDEDDLMPHDMDTLEEDDLAAPADFLDNDSTMLEEEEISFPASPQTTGKSSLNRIHLLIRQKRFYELSLFLKELPEDEQFEDRPEIESKISSLLAKATQLQKEADEAEHQGDPESALELFQKVEETVPDFPNIQESIERATRSVELASDDWALEDDQVGDDDSAGAGDQATTKSAKKRVAFFEETTKSTIRFLPILGGILIVVLAIVFITPFFGARSKLERATLLYGQCRQLLEKNQFSQARAECEAALEDLKKISLFKRNERDVLQKQINRTLTSDAMVQGLSGRVLFQGKYVKKSDMTRVQEFNRQKQEGDALLEQAEWKKAADKYSEALKTAKPIHDSFEESLLRELEDRIRIADINLSTDRGLSLMSRGELEKSLEQFSAALATAESLPEELGGDLIAQIQPKVQEIKYLQHLDLGKKYFDANDWESAIKQYEKALQLREITPEEGQGKDAESLYANMAEAELFSLINNARDAFSQSQWNNAIEQYQEAISLLNAKRELLQRINPEEIQQQLERIILRARIVQHKQEADARLLQQQYEQAISALNQVIDVVVDSGFKNDKEFKAIISGTRQTISETRGKAAISRRIAYLESNYKEIFEANYSAAVPEYLSDPKATFVRYLDDGRELYELQCLESNRGRKLRLVLFYSYNPATNTWQFYSESS